MIVLRISSDFTRSVQKKITGVTYGETPIYLAMDIFVVCPVRDKLVANIAKSRAGPMSWRVAPLSPSIASTATIHASVLRTSLVFELTTTVGWGRRQGDIARSVALQIRSIPCTLINFQEGILLLHSL